MNKTLGLMKYVTTGAVVLVAAALAAWKYWDYIRNPWTRDAQVRTQVTQVAPRVSDPIVETPIEDNLGAGDQGQPRSQGRAATHAGAAGTAVMLQRNRFGGSIASLLATTRVVATESGIPGHAIRIAKLE